MLLVPCNNAEMLSDASFGAVVPASSNCCTLENPSQTLMVPVLQLQSLQAAPRPSVAASQLSAFTPAATGIAAVIPGTNQRQPALLPAFNELPHWTQNTARALRRAQQEVTELCAAHGVPLPKEKPLLFDVVGMRSSGVQGSEKGQPISSNNGSNNGNVANATGAGRSCNASAAERRYRHANAAAAIDHHSPHLQEVGSCPASSSGAGNSSSNGGGPATATSAFPAAASGPPVYQRIYQFQPLDTILAENDAQLAAATATEASGHRANAMQRLRQQQQQRSQQDQLQRQEQQRQLQQRRQRREQHLLQSHFLPNQQQRSTISSHARPFTAPSSLIRPSNPICTTSNCRLPICCSVNNKGVSSPPVWQSMTRRREPSQPPSGTLHHHRGGHTAGGRLNNQQPRQTINTSTAGPSYELQAGWWSRPDRALGDPLLLCMPVWMREALELELMK